MGVLLLLMHAALLLSDAILVLSAARRMQLPIAVATGFPERPYMQGWNPAAKANASLLLLHSAAPLGPFW